MSAEHSLPVALAWASIRAFLQTGKRPDLSAAQIVALLARAKSEGDVWHADYRALSERQAGAFVSLHVAATSALRGCIGTIAATQANVLAEIVHNAISAASEDPRFAPLGAGELEGLEISVDVLGATELVASLEGLSQVASLAVPQVLDAQRFGVVVSRGWRRGLLLPALEGVDRPQEQVSIALNKAGIGPDEPFELERFEVLRYR